MKKKLLLLVCLAGSAGCYSMPGPRPYVFNPGYRTVRVQVQPDFYQQELNDMNEMAREQRENTDAQMNAQTNQLREMQNLRALQQEQNYQMAHPLGSW